MQLVFQHHLLLDATMILPNLAHGPDFVCFVHDSMIIMLFSLVFIGVGSTSLSYGQSFAEVLGDYCIQKCAETSLLEQPDPVGCDCKPEPGHTTLPTVVFIVRYLKKSPARRAFLYERLSSVLLLDGGGCVQQNLNKFPSRHCRARLPFM